MQGGEQHSTPIPYTLLACATHCTFGCLNDPPSPPPNPQVGVEIIQRAIRRPAKTIANNAGLEGDVIVGKLLEKVSGWARTKRALRGAAEPTGSHPSCAQLHA